MGYNKTKQNAAMTHACRAAGFRESDQLMESGMLERVVVKTVCRVWIEVVVAAIQRNGI